MTLNDLYFAIQVKKVIEFKYNNITYHLIYDKNKDGKEILKFGPLYDETVYESYGELINNAKVENHLFSYFIQNID